MNPTVHRRDITHPTTRKDVARLRREVELPVHPASAQHQRTCRPIPNLEERKKNLSRREALGKDGAGWRRIGWEDWACADNEPLQVDGKQKIMYALTRVKGVGRRYSNLVCKKADVDLNKRYATTSLSKKQPDRFWSANKKP